MKEYVSRVIYATQTYIILGEDHSSVVFIQKNEKLLTKYMQSLITLAKTNGIYLEGGFTRPQGPVGPFLSKNKIKGKFYTWEPDIKLSPLSSLLLDTFGGEFDAIYEQIGITKPTTKTIYSVLTENGYKFQDKGKTAPEGLFKKLFALGDSKLNKLLEYPYNKVNFKVAHAYGQELAFDNESSPMYKQQMVSNIQRGKALRKLCESNGGLYFVGADHINKKYAQAYGFI